MQIPKSLYANLESVTPDQSVATTVQTMNEKGIGSVVVMKDNELAGIFTERDLMTKVVAQSKDPKEVLIQDVMSTGLKTLTTESTIFDAQSLMEQQRIRHIPILTADGKPEGMLTMRHLHSFRLQQLKEENELLTALLVTDGSGG